MKDVSCCGIKCDECKDYNNSCKGCNKECGKIYWTNYVGIETCPIYNCVSTEKNLKSCGECDLLPCEKWYQFKDPSMTEKQFEDSVRERIIILKEEK